MTQLVWDQTGERLYETGVEKGVLYLPTAGVYSEGYAWNGLTTVTESPSGAEATPLYADNMKYLNLVSVEEFGGTIEAYTYPDEFGQCNGEVEPANTGITIGQQPRRTFGLSYKTLIGSDTDAEHGYKIHLIYGMLAAPSEKAYATVNDAPEAMPLSWEFTTTAVPVTGHKPTSILVINSTKVNATDLENLEEILYGTASVDPRLPLPDEVIALFQGAAIEVIATEPTFVSATGVITIPTVTGVRYRRADNNNIVTGTVTIATPGDGLVITAEPLAGYYLGAYSDSDWPFVRDE